MGSIDGTEIATWVLVAIGAISAVVAYIAYGASQREKRVDRALQVIREWLQPIGNSPSPDDCFTFLESSPEALGVLSRHFKLGSPEYELTRKRFVRLHNYFDEAWTLHKNNLIDTNLFVFQQQNLIAESDRLLEPFYKLFDATRGGETPRPLAIFLSMRDALHRT